MSFGPRMRAETELGSTTTSGRFPGPGSGTPPWNGTNPPNCGGAFVSDVKPKIPRPGPPTKPTETVPVLTMPIEFDSVNVLVPTGVGVTLGVGVGGCVISYVEPAGIRFPLNAPKTSWMCVYGGPAPVESAASAVLPSLAKSNGQT